MSRTLYRGHAAADNRADRRRADRLSRGDGPPHQTDWCRLHRGGGNHVRASCCTKRLSPMALCSQLWTRSDMSHATQQLKTALGALPELTARKTIIDMHMNIATALLESIKQRHLDVFFECEETIYKQVHVD